VAAYGYLEPYNLNFFAPMQRFWRVIEAITVAYLCFVIVMLHHRPQYGRKSIVQFLDPSLDVPITKGMHTYDDNCELTFENVWDNFDHYYIAHWVDWTLMTFMIRDPLICHMWSIGDELLELSWQHILPHFRECWWDHILMDVILSNTPAIMLSLWVQKKIGLLRYNYWGD
jgi:phosphatidylserine synthase 2